MFSEVSSASGTEKEEGGEVRYGRHDRDVAHLYRLVSSALHVSGQVGGWSRQQTPGRVCHHHTGGLSGIPLNNPLDIIVKFSRLSCCFLFELLLYSPSSL